MKTYSIRRFRPEASAFDIEISLHADNSPGAAGPGTRWARAAEFRHQGRVHRRKTQPPGP
ncbi:siderophore-interacting protein [Streptomyces sp. NPDC127119]|uniref:siderophore-interacting protein n=1 Tax=Streptomyces sp. NPDC127119 TaxID=3345370 RepID=UPI0036394BB5